MNRNQKLLLIFIGICMLAVIVLIACNIFIPKPEVKPNDIEVSQRTQEEEMVDTQVNTAKEYVNIYFIGRNEHDEEVYKAVKRVYNKDVDGSKIKFATTALINGPRLDERKKGVYTEIPASAQIINIQELSDKVVINLNSSFVNDGGADSLYKRLYQLIKTAKLNSELPVYLFIDGQRADVIGGEGIMLSQPLSNSSLDN